MQDVIKISEKYQHEADQILESTNLLRSLEAFGEVSLEGSYAYMLMLGADIDLHVKVQGLTREIAQDLVFRLITENKFSMYQFTNYFDNGMYSKENKERHSFPDGYYVGLGYWLGDKKWKIDIWLTESPSPDNIHYAKLVAEKCGAKERKAILEMKKYHQDKGLKTESVKIYEAVLSRGIYTVKEFLNYYEKD